MTDFDAPTDEELTRRAQAGESAALGLLLARHQAPMRAVALSLHRGQPPGGRGDAGRRPARLSARGDPRTVAAGDRTARRPEQAGRTLPPLPGHAKEPGQGVTKHLRHVAASRSVTIWEMDVTNPAGIADPCPPTLARLMIRRNRRVQTLRVVFPQPQR
ncbi:hypothetical protein [Streptomyces sp. NPDC002172]